MKPIILLFGLLVAVAWLPPTACEVPREAPAGEPTLDVQDLVYLGGPRPLLVRLHIQIDGKPIAAAWEAYLEAPFAYLDRNGDGVLNQEEAEHAPRRSSSSRCSSATGQRSRTVRFCTPSAWSSASRPRWPSRTSSRSRAR